MCNVLIDGMLAPHALDEKVFIRWQEHDIRYLDFAAEVESAARALSAFGIVRGDRVAVCLRTRPRIIALMYASAWVAACFVPIDASLDSQSLSGRLCEIEARLAIVEDDADCEGPIYCVVVKSSFFDAKASTPTRSSPLAVSATGLADIALILYTTGTSGRAKPCALTNGNVLTNALALVDTWQVSDRDTVLHGLPLYHTHGLLVATGVTMAAGASLRLLPGFSAARALADGRDATVLMGVPHHYSALLDHDSFGRASFPQARLFISGGALLNQAAHQRFTDRTGHVLLERYGITEACMVASNPVVGERRVGTVGLPLRDVQVRIVDPHTLQDLATGAFGEIWLRGPNVFDSYPGPPECRRAAFHEGWLRTGDVGLLQADGYLEYLGRLSEVIELSDGAMHPAWLERIVEELPHVEECVVFGSHQHGPSTALVCCIATVPAYAMSADTVLAHIERRAPRQRTPISLWRVDAVPRSASGKVSRRALRTQWGEARSTTSPIR